MTSSVQATPPTNNDAPPRRHSFWRTANKIVLAHLILILAILVPLGIHENRQAQRDWADFKTHWEAKGEIFDLEKLIPPEIPDEENFAATPIIAEIFTDPDNNRLASIDINELPGFSEITISSENPNRILGGFKNKLTDYLKNPKDFPTDKKTAEIILQLLKPLEPLLNELEQACQRSKARYPLDYSNPITADRPHLTALVNVSRPLLLRIRAHIILGNSDSARSDMQLLLHTAYTLENESSLISTLVASALINQALTAIWEGLRSHLFKPKDLILLEKLLHRINLKRSFVSAIRHERANNLSMLENDPTNYFELLDGDITYGYMDIKTLAKMFQLLGFGQTFVIRNKLNYCQFYQKHFLSTKGEINTEWLDLNTVSEIEKHPAALSTSSFFSNHPYTILLSGGSASVFITITERTAQTATRIDLARIAIALELYRSKHGSYPATLSPLAPAYLDTTPRDLITGDPLHYHIKTDGTPIIYSVGLNKTDDGGQLKENHSQGDWVWQYTLPPDFNKADWRK